MADFDGFNSSECSQANVESLYAQLYHQMETTSVHF